MRVYGMLLYSTVKTLFALMATLLVTSPALGLDLSGKGQVDKFATGDLPTCDDTTVQLHGWRVYDITTNQEKTCSEASAGWVVSAGAGGWTDKLLICGDQDTINNNTVYYGPVAAVAATTFNTEGFQCDINAAGNTTYGTVAAAVFDNQAFYVTGMTCRDEDDTTGSVEFEVVTTAGASLVPAVACTIDGTGALTESSCVTNVQTTTAIGAGDTIAVSATSTTNIGANMGFICTIRIAF